nr:hypothetical protein [Halomarina oriensis]
MTTRRSLLTYCALATLPLAGCLGTADPADDESGADTTDPTPTPTPSGNTTDDLPGGNATDDAGGTRLRGTGGPGVTVVDTDTVDAAVEHAVEVVTDAATEDAPPGLRVSVTNTTDETLAVGEGRAVVFAYVSDTAGSLVLLPPEGEYPAEAGCWRLADPVAVTMEYRTRTLDPGETATRELDVYALPGEDACLPVGEYRFETTFRTGPADDGATGDAATEHSWGFSVLLE